MRDEEVVDAQAEAAVRRGGVQEHPGYPGHLGPEFLAEFPAQGGFQRPVRGLDAAAWRAPVRWQAGSRALEEQDAAFVVEQDRACGLAGDRWFCVLGHAVYLSFPHYAGRKADPGRNIPLTAK